MQFTSTVTCTQFTLDSKNGLQATATLVLSVQGSLSSHAEYLSATEQDWSHYAQPPLLEKHRPKWMS